MSRPWIMNADYEAWVGEADNFNERISRACHVPHLFTADESFRLWELKNQHVPAIRAIEGRLHYSDREAWMQLEIGVRLISESHQIEVRSITKKRWYTYSIIRYADGRTEWSRSAGRNSSRSASRTRGTALEEMLQHIEETVS
jgi:hypothetical protein